MKMFHTHEREREREREVLEEDGLGQLRKILKPVSDKAWKTFLEREREREREKQAECGRNKK